MRRAACFYARQNGFFGGASSNEGCIAPNDANGTYTDRQLPSGPVGWAIRRVARRRRGDPQPRPPHVLRGSATAADDRRHEFRCRRLRHGLVEFQLTDRPRSIFVRRRQDSRHGHDQHPSASRRYVGGYVQVNSDCSSGSSDDLCGSSSGGLKVDSNASNFTAPMTYVVGSCQAASGTINGGSTRAAFVGDPLEELRPPQLADYPAGRCAATDPPLTAGARGCKFNKAGVVNLAPGVYYGGWEIVNNNVELVLEPGMYIFAGGGVKWTGGSITSVQGAGGAPAPVMFFNTDDPSTNSGQANIDFVAVNTLTLRPIASGPYRNILIWNDAAGSNPDATISLGGQATLDIAGPSTTRRVSTLEADRASDRPIPPPFKSSPGNGMLAETRPLHAVRPDGCTRSRRRAWCDRRRPAKAWRSAGLAFRPAARPAPGRRCGRC